MADQNYLTQLTKAHQDLRSISLEALYRKNLGEESFESQIKPIYEAVLGKADFAVKYAETVSNDAVNNTANILRNIVSHLQSQASQNNPNYIGNKANCLNNVRTQFNALSAWWPDFVSAAVEKSGILNDGGLKAENQKALEALQTESKKALENLKAESKKIIDEAREYAKEIEAGARKTAARISVQEAQRQFTSAKRPLAIQITVWAVLSLIFGIGLGILVYYFSGETLPNTWTWQVGYIAAIHFAALTAIASILAYCLSILRAQLHMYNHNSHRLRITNSMEAFIQSAITSEQRDFILARLVEEIADFGNSGLIKPEQGDTSKIILDPLSKFTKSNT